MQCTNNLKQISLALENYYGSYQKFPSPNADGHSWRIRLLPFIEASPLFNQYRFDEPWNGPTNATLNTRPIRFKGNGVRVFPAPAIFRCNQHSAEMVSYLMFVGEHAFGKPNGYRTLDELSDPLDTIIVIAESTRHNLHWLAPEDLDANGPSIIRAISSEDPSGPAVLFADGNIFRLNSTRMANSTLEAMISIDGGEAVDRAQLLRDGQLSFP
jgi:hypothetical protein